MISYLRGKILSKTLNSFILDVHDVGYQVYASENFINDLKINTEAEIYIHHHVREEASDLYGFKTNQDLELFALLLSVSGVGPKSALGVLAIASSTDIREAIMRNDANLLTKVSGIGKKTAERIVLELKNKVIRISGETTTFNTASLIGSDEIDALMSLGYSLNDARNALNTVAPEISDSGERVKTALKKMAKK
jgi:Holliday junction DNA helicase RuvA